MRIWQRSAMLWMRSCTGEFAICTVKASVGVAAYGTTLASVTRRVRAGTTRLGRFGGARIEILEEAIDGRPRLGAAAESPPLAANQADQAVAQVDRHDVIAAAPDAVHEQCF